MHRTYVALIDIISISTKLKTFNVSCCASELDLIAKIQLLLHLKRFPFDRDDLRYALCTSNKYCARRKNGMSNGGFPCWAVPPFLAGEIPIFNVYLSSTVVYCHFTYNDAFRRFPLCSFLYSLKCALGCVESSPNCLGPNTTQLRVQSLNCDRCHVRMAPRIEPSASGKTWKRFRYSNNHVDYSQKIKAK